MIVAQTMRARRCADAACIRRDTRGAQVTETAYRPHGGTFFMRKEFRSTLTFARGLTAPENAGKNDGSKTLRTAKNPAEPYLAGVTT
ncbi:hypothetical protein [Paraburkholderia tropica]|uniref:hypothetical protein n=1 Tax=Paraburkholderia tropica TaxID=92647 RepID=UPI001CC43C52|nr:hypothetical protein [Paraburkholderia tropica]